MTDDEASWICNPRHNLAKPCRTTAAGDAPGWNTRQPVQCSTLYNRKKPTSLFIGGNTCRAKIYLPGCARRSHG